MTDSHSRVDHLVALEPLSGALMFKSMSVIVHGSEGRSSVPPTPLRHMDGHAGPLDETRWKFGFRPDASDLYERFFNSHVGYVATCRIRRLDV